MNRTIPTDDKARRLPSCISWRSHLSVFYLMVRSRLLVVCAVLLLLVISEVSLFALHLHTQWNDLTTGEVSHALCLEYFWERFHVLAPFSWAFLLITGLVASFGLSRGSQVSYTLRRLSVEESMVSFWQAAFAQLCYLLLLAVQVILAFGLGQWYVAVMGTVAPTDVNGQSVLLAFYRHELLHSLFPLGDLSRTLCTVSVGITMAISSAYFGFCLRQHKKPFLCFTALFVSVVDFSRPVGQAGMDLVYAAALMFMAVCMIRTMKRGGWRHEEEA